MMLERGLDVDHTTLYRWVQHYARPVAVAIKKRRFSIEQLVAVFKQVELGWRWRMPQYRSGGTSLRNGGRA